MGLIQAKGRLLQSIGCGRCALHICFAHLCFCAFVHCALCVVCVCVCACTISQLNAELELGVSQNYKTGNHLHLP
jgi:hypothetical protein